MTILTELEINSNIARIHNLEFKIIQVKCMGGRCNHPEEGNKIKRYKEFNPTKDNTLFITYVVIPFLPTRPTTGMYDTCAAIAEGNYKKREKK